MTKINAYMINCRTGCTCCRWENHVTGPFSSLDIATQKKESYIRSKRVASQFATNGVYNIIKTGAEQLPDGRLIIANQYIAQGWADDDVEDTFLPAGDSFYLGETIE